MTYSYDRREAAAYQEISIGALERGVRTLAKNLEQKFGLKTEIDVFRSGHGSEGSGSYVELEVEATWTDAEGEQKEASSYVKFMAGGYGSLTEGRQIGGSEGWRPMAAVGLKRILSELERQGWKPPTSGAKAAPVQPEWAKVERLRWEEEVKKGGGGRYDHFKHPPYVAYFFERRDRLNTGAGQTKQHPWVFHVDNEARTIFPELAHKTTVEMWLRPDGSVELL